MERMKFHALSFVKLALKFDPEKMQKMWKQLNEAALLVKRKSYQWRRKVWRKADMPSIAIRIDTVAPHQKPNVKKIMIEPA